MQKKLLSKQYIVTLFFDDKTKLKMISSIKVSSEQTVSLLKILNTIDKKETSVLASSPSMYKDKIKAGFETQKKEIKKVVPTIQHVFLSYTVKAFSFTFEAGAIILFPGVLFALFSDKRREKSN